MKVFHDKEFLSDFARTGIMPISIHIMKFDGHTHIKVI